MVVQAYSGTGKTACFGIVALERIDTELHECQTIILSPTRELALQSYSVLTALAKYLKVDIELCIGGSPNSKNISKAQIVIATPGRLLSTLWSKNINCQSVKMLFIDEADELMSQGFIEQLYSIISDFIPNNSQIALFSATFEESLRDMTSKFLNNPLYILLELYKTTLDGISQFHVNVEHENNKFTTLCDLYHSMQISQAIIYVNSKKQVQALGDRLGSQGYTVSQMHGDMTQIERNEIMNKFRQGTSRILLSSDITARGIDVQSVNVVINYDFPTNFETYIHRAGRSGRFGRKGTVITFITNNELNQLSELESHYSTSIPGLGTLH